MEEGMTFRNKLTGGLVAVATLLGSTAAFAGEITFWSWRQEDKAAYAEFIKDFNKKHPDVTVKFEAFEPTNYQTILSTALAAGKGPDVIQVRAYGNLETVAKPGYLLALDETNVPELKGFPASALKAESMRSDGKVYAVPFASQTMLVLYNKDLFDKHGIAEPQTWDELLAASKKLKDAGLSPFANGTATAWQNETIVSALLSSQLGKGFEADILSGKATFEDKRFVDALTKLNELKQYFAPSFSGIDYASAQQLFIAGRAAMFAGGSFEAANFLRQNPALKIGVFAAPGLDKAAEKLVGVYYDGGYAVNAKSEKQADALKFVRYLATKDFGDKFANTLSNISPIPGVEFKDPTLAKVAELNKNSIPYLFLVNFRYQEPSGSVLIQAGVQKMMADKATPAEVGAEVTKGIATYFEPFKK
jgi:raffinose/stachyose/melibiose transport system substrate-binding protein